MRRRSWDRPTSTTSSLPRAQVLYLEGYLWDEPDAKAAYRLAARTAHDAGNRVAFTLSDAFCVDRHRTEFLELVESDVDVLFANEAEITSLYEVDRFDDALQRVQHHCEIAALTRSERGAVIVARDEVHVVDAQPVDESRRHHRRRRPVRRRIPLRAHARLPPRHRGPPRLPRRRRGHQPPRWPPRGVAGGVGGAPPRGVMKLPRYRTGDGALDGDVAALVERVSDPADADQIFELVASALRMAHDGADRGDLKLANAALKEMRNAFRVFAPYRAARKVAIFGSARTQPDDPLYVQARDFAAAMAALDWMVVTGAGPGIMEAGIEGAGAENAFGVGIELPFETTTSQFIADDPKLINFRYFFTRKLEFIKESDAFVLLPGGYGTLDEAFELLTLLQTGKAQPAPVVMLDVPGGTYWQHWGEFVKRAARATAVRVGRGRSPVLRHRLHRDRGRRGARLLLQLPLAAIRARAARPADAYRADGRRAGGPQPRLRRHRRARRDRGRHRLRRMRSTTTTTSISRALAFRFDRHGWARLRMLIDRLNGRPTA